MNEFNNKKVKYLYTGKLENIAGEIKEDLNKLREKSSSWNEILNIIKVLLTLFYSMHSQQGQYHPRPTPLVAKFCS